MKYLPIILALLFMSCQWQQPQIKPVGVQAAHGKMTMVYNVISNEPLTQQEVNAIVLKLANESMYDYTLLMYSTKKQPDPYAESLILAGEVTLVETIFY